MASKPFSRHPTGKIKGGLDAIMAGSIYAVPQKAKAKKHKMEHKQGKITKEVVTHVSSGRKRKVLCQADHPPQIQTTVKNGGIGVSGKEIQTKVILGDPSTYTFEMLIERYGSPKRWPTNVKHYDRKKGQWIDVDLREKWDHRIGKNRQDK